MAKGSITDRAMEVPHKLNRCKTVKQEVETLLEFLGEDSNFDKAFEDGFTARCIGRYDDLPRKKRRKYAATKGFVSKLEEAWRKDQSFKALLSMMNELLSNDNFKNTCMMATFSFFIWAKRQEPDKPMKETLEKWLNRPLP